MRTNLGLYVEKCRLKKGLTHKQLAKMIGLTNVSTGCQRTRAMENHPSVDDEWFWKAAEILDMEDEIIEILVELNQLESYSAENESLDKPIEIHGNVILSKYHGRFFYLPEGIKTLKQAFEYAAMKARSFQAITLLRISQRVQISFDERGDFLHLKETKAERERALLPHMRVRVTRKELPAHEHGNERMRIRKGVWVHPERGDVFDVTKHERWLMKPENQRKAELSEQYVHALNQLDVEKDIDLIRMIGVRAGLIRIRDYSNRVSVQFYADQRDADAVLALIVKAVPKIADDKFAYLEIHNMSDDSVACLYLPDLKTIVRNNEPVGWKQPAEGRKRSLIILDKRVNSLLNNFSQE